MCGRWFFDELVLVEVRVEVRLDDLCGIPAWRHQTGSSFPERCLMCLAIGPPSGDRHRSRKHVGDTGNQSGILLPVWCRHGGIRRKSTGPASDSPNPSRKRVYDTEYQPGKLLPVYCRHGGFRGDGLPRGGRLQRPQGWTTPRFARRSDSAFRASPRHGEGQRPVFTVSLL